jgi:hypothetical protein
LPFTPYLKQGVWAFVLLILAATLALINLSTRSRNSCQIEAQIRAAFAPAELVSVDDIGQSPLRIIVTLRSEQSVSFPWLYFPGFIDRTGKCGCCPHQESSIDAAEGFNTEGY